MARHFLKGEFSVYYWGEGYYGSLDPVLLAPLFKIFGPSPGVSQWIPFAFSLGTVALYYRYARGVLDPWSARVSSLILALAPPALFRITFSVYNYGILIFLGIIHLSLFSRLWKGDRRKGLFLITGLAMGFSWYYFRLILAFWAAVLLGWVVLRNGPKAWAEAKIRIAAFSLARIWNEIILLRGVPIPRFLRRGLAAVNIYNLFNFSMACFLWVRGNWFWSLGRFRIKLYLWPILKSSLLMALFTVAVVQYRKILPFWRSLRSDIHAQMFVLGSLAGYSPAFYGYATGTSPSSPGGLVALPDIARNVALAVPELISQLTGASGIPLLGGLSIALTISGLVMLGRLFWIQTRRRFRSGTAVKPSYPIAALWLAAAVFGIVGTVQRDPGTVRFFIPLFLCLPVGIAMVLEGVKQKSRLLAWGMLLVVLGNSFFSNLVVWRSHASPSRYESILQNLAEEKIRGGYADYQSAYYLTFLAQEEIILDPSSGKERYPRYLEYVRSLDQIVLLGEAVPPDGTRVEIKGIVYEIVRRDVWEGMPIAFLKNAAAH